MQGEADAGRHRRARERERDAEEGPPRPEAQRTAHLRRRRRACSRNAVAREQVHVRIEDRDEHRGRAAHRPHVGKCVPARLPPEGPAQPRLDRTGELQGDRCTCTRGRRQGPRGAARAPTRTPGDPGTRARVTSQAVATPIAAVPTPTARQSQAVFATYSGRHGRGEVAPASRRCPVRKPRRRRRGWAPRRARPPRSPRRRAAPDGAAGAGRAQAARPPRRGRAPPPQRQPARS